MKMDNVIWSNMDGPRDYHTKWNKSEIPYDITYMWNLKYDTNERYREQTCGWQGGEEVGVGWIGSLGLADANHYI